MSSEVPPESSLPADPFAVPDPNVTHPVYPPVASPPTYGTPPPPPYGTPPPPPYGPPPPGGYGYPPSQPYAMARTSGKANTVLVLGILSLVVCQLLGIVALVMAPGAREEIRMSQGALTGEGQIKTGVICSWIGIGLLALFIVGFAVLVFAGAASSNS